MIKTRGQTADGRHFIIFGLSRLNVEKLLEGMPIKVDLQEPPPKGLDLPGGAVVLIVGGETEAAIVAELGEFVKIPS